MQIVIQDSYNAHRDIVKHLKLPEGYSLIDQGLFNFGIMQGTREVGCMRLAIVEGKFNVHYLVTDFALISKDDRRLGIYSSFLDAMIKSAKENDLMVAMPYYDIHKEEIKISEEMKSKWDSLVEKGEAFISDSLLGKGKSYIVYFSGTVKEDFDEVIKVIVGYSIDGIPISEFSSSSPKDLVDKEVKYHLVFSGYRKFGMFKRSFYKTAMI